MASYAQLLEELTAEREELILQRDQVTLQRDALIAQRDALATQRDDVIIQRDIAAVQCATLTAQRDQFSTRCDEVTRQRDALNSQFNDIFPQFHEAAERRDALLASRSWRITKPARLVATAVRTVLRLPGLLPAEGRAKALQATYRPSMTLDVTDADMLSPYEKSLYDILQAACALGNKETGC